MAFRVGQEVVCIDDSAPACGFGETPKKGETYVISRIGDSSLGSPNFIDVDGVKPNHPDYPGFRSSRFRPIIKKSTDTGMAILREILDRESYAIKTPAKA